MKVVADWEANGLLREVTKIWCMCAYDIETNQEYQIDVHDGNYKPIIDFMSGVTHLIGHNIIGYDLFLIYKLAGINYTGYVCDTYDLSLTLNPDRTMPEGCDTHVQDPITGKKRRIGPHGLEAWGYRAARAKPRIDRWDVWDPKIMHRCTEDVRINVSTLQMLLEEGNLREVPYVR